MKSKLLKKLKLVICTGLLVMVCSVPAWAGNTGYGVTQIGNTGYSYTIDVTSSHHNKKAVSYRTWVVTPEYLSYTDTTTPSYGVAHALFDDAGTTRQTDPVWLKTATRKTGTWLSGCGIKDNYYRMGVRMDSVLSGKATSTGVFNSDSY